MEYFGHHCKSLKLTLSSKIQTISIVLCSFDYFSIYVFCVVDGCGSDGRAYRLMRKIWGLKSNSSRCSTILVSLGKTLHPASLSSMSAKCQDVHILYFLQFIFHLRSFTQLTCNLYRFFFFLLFIYLVFTCNLNFTKKIKLWFQNLFISL